MTEEWMKIVPPDRAPAGFDTGVAHNARVWNYWLGGKDNYAADRAAGDRVFQMFPGIVQVARAGRAFLGRAVRFLAGEAGIRQFLDLGTGLPTADNTHEIAQRVAPDARVVYVDNDPLVLAHARALLTGTAPGTTAYVRADVRDPAAILRQAAATLDLTEPVALMMLGILNFIAGTGEAETVVSQFLAAVPAGSYLAITHPTLELGGEANVAAMRYWNEHARPPIVARSGAEITRFLAGVELVPPGLVSCPAWRPDQSGQPPETVALYGAVGKKT